MKERFLLWEEPDVPRRMKKQERGGINRGKYVIQCSLIDGTKCRDENVKSDKFVVSPKFRMKMLMPQYVILYIF